MFRLVVALGPSLVGCVDPTPPGPECRRGYVEYVKPTVSTDTYYRDYAECQAEVVAGRFSRVELGCWMLPIDYCMKQRGYRISGYI